MQLVVPPPPRNVQPGTDDGRRKARANALAHTYENDADAYYVGAAPYPHRVGTYALSVVRASTGECVAAGSVRVDTATQAEEAAIALALTCRPLQVSTVLSDSLTAINNYSRMTVGRVAHEILPPHRGGRVYLRWFPAHVGRLQRGTPNRNEDADTIARELAHRATAYGPSTTDGDAVASRDDHENDFSPITGYSDVLEWYRARRRKMARPHRSLTREEEVHLRQLQTGSVLTPALAHHVCPGLYPSNMCSVCGVVIADLPHVLWGCDEHERRGHPRTIPEWVTLGLVAKDFASQSAVTQLLATALGTQRRTEQEAGRLTGAPGTPRAPLAGP